jgi:hypothetical protein
MKETEYRDNEHKRAAIRSPLQESTCINFILITDTITLDLCNPDIVVEVYIDDIVVKLAGLSSHLADFRLAFEKMCRYGLKMNPLKCAFGVSAGKFCGFIVHKKGVEIDPK